MSNYVRGFMERVDRIKGEWPADALLLVERQDIAAADHIRTLETQVKASANVIAAREEECRLFEAQLARVRELPRYGTQEIKDEYGDDPSVLWIAEYELEAALDNPKSDG